MNKQNSTGNNKEISALFQSLCGTDNQTDDDKAKNIIRLIKIIYDAQLSQVGENIDISYKDLTDLVYKHDNLFILESEQLENLSQKIKGEILLDDYCTANISNANNYQNHFMRCYNKIIKHILLAQTQREYIRQSAHKAENIAKQAKQTARLAEKLAKSANKTYKSMFANYITILGIFTAIIVTIFGGLNVAKTVIDYGNAPFSTIVFLTALVLMCIVCLLYFLALIVMKLTDKKNVLTLPCKSKPSDSEISNSQTCILDINHFIIAFMTICIIAMIGAYCSSPNKTTPVTKPATQEQKSTP